MQNVMELLKDLIAIPSVSPSIRPVEGVSGEALVCERVRDALAAAGIASEMVDVADGRPNLYARLDFGRPQTVILSAHTDTVPADDFDGEAFDPREADGAIHGRGSCDTKASLALFAGAMLRAASAGGCDFNLTLAAVCDEEAGFLGSKAAARHLKAGFAIAGEPTGLHVLNRHKGVMRFVVSASGVSSHSSTPDLGRNAIYPLARAVLAIGARADDWRARQDPVLGPRTVAVTTISGGQAPNIIPDSARAQVDVRSLPGDTQEGLMTELAECCGPDVTISAPFVAGPPLHTPEDNPLLQRFLAASGRSLTCAAYATDAAEYAAAGIPAIVFGPGDAALAHTSREHVNISDIEEAERILGVFLGLR